LANFYLTDKKSFSGEEMVKVIADVGSNFNGSKELAKKYITACKKTGVDIVKFQIYTADTLFHKTHPAYGVVKENMNAIPVSWIKELKEFADKTNIEFTATPTDLSHIEILEQCNINTYKIASGDLTFLPLIENAAKTGKNIVLSTGMANLTEIKEAVHTVNICNNNNITILHCISNYPPKIDEINLYSIKKLKAEFSKYQIGFSDHTKGYSFVLAAIGLGATVIEKHITFDNNLGTPDAPFAMTVKEFENMTKEIRQLEKALGKEDVFCANGEKNELFFARRGLYAKETIEKGELIKFEKIGFLRPCKGIKANKYLIPLGKKAKTTIKKHSVLTEDLLE
jgi:sialic acid synthase SpsE